MIFRVIAIIQLNQKNADGPKKFVLTEPDCTKKYFGKKKKTTFKCSRIYFVKLAR